MEKTERHLLAIAKILAVAVTKGNKREAERIVEWAYGGPTQSGGDDFVEKYLTPTYKYGAKECKAFVDRFIIGKEPYDVDRARKAIVSLDYNQFLATPYWRAISWFIKRSSYKQCRRCGKRGGILHVHHKTYKNHGDELHHLEDLVCLCNNCHKVIHDSENK